ncbi:MAG: hypothetical protein JWN19_2784 [Arthrobacter sp.]|jgi:hypothetical protein|nr:hypothetical protein [Arthrobacter sp.]
MDVGATRVEVFADGRVMVGGGKIAPPPGMDSYSAAIAATSRSGHWGRCCTIRCRSTISVTLTDCGTRASHPAMADVLPNATNLVIASGRSDVWPDIELHPPGFLAPEARTPMVLQPGHLIDGYGLPRENFTSPVGKNFPGRALPDFSLEKFGPRDGSHQYEVLHEIPAGAQPLPHRPSAKEISSELRTRAEWAGNEWIQ